MSTGATASAGLVDRSAFTARDHFIELGEPLAMVVGVLSLVAWLLNEYFKTRRERFQQQRTARYWIYYNITNRINQNLMFLPILRDIIADERFAAWEIAATSPSTDASAFHGLVEELRRRLQGFKETFANDDVLTDAISFEFSLLSKTEKSLMLKNFEVYTKMVDDVKLVSEMLRGSSFAGEPGADRALAIVRGVEAQIAWLLNDAIEILRELHRRDRHILQHARIEDYARAAEQAVG